MLPPPNGVWGMPPEFLKTVAGYNPDVKGNREDARKIMKGLGYGPDNKLTVKVSTRNIAIYRDAAVILIDHLKEIYIDAVLEKLQSAATEEEWRVLGPLYRSIIELRDEFEDIEQPRAVSDLIYVMF